MVKNSELNIGPQIQRAECLVATVIGEAQSGSVSRLQIICTYDSCQLPPYRKSPAFLDVLPQRLPH
jgi:hypothetical protein